MAEKDLTARLRVQADDAQPLEKIEKALKALDPAAKEAAGGFQGAGRAVDTFDSKTDKTNMSVEEAIRVFQTWKSRLSEAEKELRDSQKQTAGLQRQVKQLSSRLQKANRDLSRFVKTGKGVKQVSQAFASLKGNLGSAVIQRMGQAFRDAIGTIAEFGERMSAVEAVLNPTAEQMKALTGIAREMGATTRFSATESAEALEFLARAGFSVEQSIAALPGTLQLAQAGALDLGSAADIVSNVLSAFGAGASELTRFGDALAATAANSNTNIMQMGEAMKQVGPIAASLGISIEATSAAVGILANAGIQGEAGGNALKVILASLVAPSKKAQKAIADLGLSMDQVNPQTHSLTEIVRTLSDAGLEAGDAFTIFGRRGAPAILALTGQVPQLEELNKKVNDSAGTMERMAKIMNDNLGGAFKSFASAAESVVLTIGESGLTKALRILLEDATKTARGSSEQFDLLGKSLGTVVLAVGALADGVKAGFSAISGTIGTVFSFVLEKLTALGGLIPDALEWLGFDDAAKALRGKLKFIEEVAAEFRENVSKDSLESLENARNGLSQKLGTLVDIWTKSGQQAKEGSAGFVEAAKNAESVADSTAKAADEVDSSTTKMQEAYKGAISSIKDLFGTLDPNEIRARVAIIDDKTLADIKARFEKAIETIKVSGGAITEEIALIGNTIGSLTTAFDPVAAGATKSVESISKALEEVGLSASGAAEQAGSSITVWTTKLNEAGQEVKVIEEITREAALKMTMEELEQADPRLQSYVERLREAQGGLGEAGEAAGAAAKALSDPAEKVEDVAKKTEDLAGKSKNLAGAQEEAGKAAKNQAAGLQELVQAITSGDLDKALAGIEERLKQLNGIDLSGILGTLGKITEALGGIQTAAGGLSDLKISIDVSGVLAALGSVEQKAKDVATAVNSIDEAGGEG